MESTIVITGGTGRLGKVFSKLLSEKNIAHTITSRNQPAGIQNWMPMDLGNGNGMQQALAGKKIVFNLASGTKGPDKNIDVNGTQRLIDAAKQAGIEHFIHISIVGIDKVPVSYYKLKLQAEEVVKNSGLPFTILRATQFHEFIHQVLQQFLFLPFAFLPTKIKIQPVDTHIVADEMLKLINKQPSNSTFDVGGPEVLELGHLVNTWKAAQHKTKWIIHFPTIGKTLKALNAGGLTCPGKSFGGTSWQQWLNNNYGTA